MDGESRIATRACPTMNSCDTSFLTPCRRPDSRGSSPQSTLERGFAIARDDHDAPLTSREAAIKHTSFRVEFRDGAVTVDNREYEKGNRQ